MTHEIAHPTQADLARHDGRLDWSIGDVMFGMYRIEAIRTGGMGVVYLCRAVDGDAGRAIKTLMIDPLLDERVRALMRAEADCWLRLGRHPNLVTCEWLYQTPRDKRLWLHLERIEGHPERGTSLREWMAAGPPIDLPQILRIAGGICEGMAFVGSMAAEGGAGVVHRDLKPENVLMDREGFARVTDFGLARRFRVGVSDRTDEADPVAGTPWYMAPEVWKPGYVASAASDVYAFGVLLWELLAGEHPFTESVGNAAALRYAHQETAPRDPRDFHRTVPESLANLALACLAKNPLDRPQSFVQILEALRREPLAVPWSKQAEPLDPVVLSAMDGNQIFGLITLGRLEEAEQLLARALARDPENGSLHRARVQILQATGRFAEARDSLERLASLIVPEGPFDGAVMSFAPVMKAEALQCLGRLEEALATVDRALSNEPSHRLLLDLRGQLLWALGRPAEALLAFDAATAVTEGWRSLFTKSRILHAMGRDEEADRCLIQALAKNPNDESALCQIASQLAEVGSRRKAMECVDRAMQLNPGHYEAWSLKARFLEEDGRAAEAEDVLRRLLKDRPGDLSGCIQLIRILQEGGRRDEIGEFVLAAARSRPRNAHEYLLKGSFSSGLGYWQDALKSLDAGLALQPGQRLGWISKGNAHLHCGEFDEADRAYRRAATLAPQDAGIQKKIAALGALLEGHRLLATDPQRALEAYERALESDSENGVFLYAKAAALGMLKRPGAALPLLDQSLARFRNPSIEAIVEKIRLLGELSLWDDARTLAKETIAGLDAGPDKARLEGFLALDIRSERPREEVAWSFHDLANEHQRARKIEDAEECFRRAMYLNPAQAAHAGALAACLMILSDSRPAALAESLAISERLLSESPDHPLMLFNYAQALDMAADHQKALQVARKLLKLTPDDPHLRSLIFRIQSALDRA